MNKISKIIWSLFSGAVCLVYKGDVVAHSVPDQNNCTVYSGYTCGDGSTYNPYFGNFFDRSDGRCSGTGVKCYRGHSGVGFTIKYCSSCRTPYSLVTDGPIDNSCSNPPTWYVCRCVCSNCTASGSWSAYGTGYQKYTGQGCDCSGSTATCKTITDYRCASGYYGTATSGSTGCTVCPSNATCSGGNNSTFKCNKGYYKNGSGCTQCASPATTKAAGSYDISECYIPEGTYSDTTGKYAMNCDCPYAGRDNCDSGSGSSSSSA